MLIEHLFLLDQERVASVHDLILKEVFLEWLDNLDAKLEVVLRVGVDELANVLPLVWELKNDWAEVAEQVVHEELVEVFLEVLVGQLREAWRWGAICNVLVDLLGEVLAHVHYIGKAMVDWVQFLEHQ